MDLRFPQRSASYLELQYMGNTIFIKDRRVCTEPLRRSYTKITATYNS